MINHSNGNSQQTGLNVFQTAKCNFLKHVGNGICGGIAQVPMIPAVIPIFTDNNMAGLAVYGD